MAHHIIGKGKDDSELLCWVQTRCRGRDNVTLRVFKPIIQILFLKGFSHHQPSKGHIFILKMNEDQYVRQEFLENLCKVMQKVQEVGDSFVLMLVSNGDLHSGNMHNALFQCNFQ